MIKALCMFMMIFAALLPNEGTRYDTAVITETYYDYHEQAYVTVFITSDGNEWAAVDVPVSEYTECIVKFDTMHTSTKLDDAIISIICE